MAEQLDPERVADICPECGWLSDRSASEIWKNGERNGRRRWRWIAAMLVGMVAVVFVGQGVWRAKASTYSGAAGPWVQRGTFDSVHLSSSGPMAAGTELPILMGDDLVAIAEGQSSGDQLKDLLPSPDELHAQFPGGVMLLAVFGEPQVGETATRSWGWPLPWYLADSVRVYDDFRIRENENKQSHPQLRPPQLIQSHIMYDTPTDGFARSVHWDLAGPAATILVWVIGNALLGIILRLVRSKQTQDQVVRIRRVAVCTLTCGLLVLMLLSIKTESTWRISAMGQSGTLGTFRVKTLNMVPEAEVLELSRAQSTPREIATAILDHASSPPTKDQVVHLALAHPQDIESESESFWMAGPFSLGNTSTSHLVRRLPSGASEPIGTPSGKRFFYYGRWSSLTVRLPATGGSVRSVTINVANLTVIVFLLWLMWIGVNAFGRVWVRRRTGRRAKRGLCLNCAYEILPA